MFLGLTAITSNSYLIAKAYLNIKKKKNKFEGCPLQPSQRELANKTKSWPDQKKKKKK
jgi:hypothetical protein